MEAEGGPGEMNKEEGTESVNPEPEVVHESISPHPEHGSVSPHPGHESASPHPESESPHPEHHSASPHPGHESVAPHPEHESVSPHPERHSASDHPGHESVSPHPERHSASDHPGHESVSPHPERHSASDHSVHESVSPHPERHSASDHPGHESVSPHPERHSASDHSVHESVSPHPERHSASDHSVHESVSPHPERQSASAHPGHESVSPHPERHSASDHSVHESVSPHPERHSASDHPGHESVSPHPEHHSASDHLGHESVSPHPERHSGSDHPGHESVSPHPERHSALDHPGHESVSPHPERHSALDHPGHESVSPHPERHSASDPPGHESVSPHPERHSGSDHPGHESVSPHPERHSASDPPGHESVSPHPERHSASAHPGHESVSPHPERQSASAHPGHESVSPHPERHSDLTHPEHESVSPHPEHQSALAHPGHESVSPHPDRQSASAHPGHESVSPHPDRQSASAHPEHESVSPHPERQSASAHPGHKSVSPHPERHSASAHPGHESVSPHPDRKTEEAEAQVSQSKESIDTNLDESELTVFPQPENEQFFSPEFSKKVLSKELEEDDDFSDGDEDDLQKEIPVETEAETDDEVIPKGERVTVFPPADSMPYEEVLEPEEEEEEEPLTTFPYADAFPLLNVEEQPGEVVEEEKITIFGEENIFSAPQGPDEPDVMNPTDEPEVLDMSACPHPPPALLMSETIPDEALFGPYLNILNLIWSYGQNRKVPVINVSNADTNAIFYTCSNTGVVFDFILNTQRLLQGHANVITCTCVSEDKRWVVTADKGKDSMLIVWDIGYRKAIPVRTIFDCHPDGGTAAVALTPDARYLATLSAADVQTIAIWDWTIPDDVPMCTAQLKPDFGFQNYILFNPEDITQLVTNGETQVIFYCWAGAKIRYTAPVLTDADFRKSVGKFSQTIFFSNSTSALTATSIGNFVVWETYKPKYLANPEESGEFVPFRRALKIVHIQDRAITVLATTGQLIATGDSNGTIRFYDQSLKMMNWYQDFDLGPISSISFAYFPEFEAKDKSKGKYQPDATLFARTFAVRDFVVGTSTAVFAHVSVDGTVVKIIGRDFDSHVHAMAAHPKGPVLAIGSYGGLLKLWQYRRRTVLASRQFDRNGTIRCLVYSPDAKYIAVGFTNGVIGLLDAISLDDLTEEPLCYTSDAITHLAFSHNMEYLASADTGYAVTLFQRTCDAEKLKKSPYIFVGRHRAHSKSIQEIMFGVKLDHDLPRLLSLAEDRLLVEYDLEGSSYKDFRVLSIDRIEQSAVPYCMVWYPPFNKESFVLTANDQYKFKLYNVTTKMCRKTLQGPTYGSPITKVVMSPQQENGDSRRFLAYMLRDKVGLSLLPLDGNPHKSSALIAHPFGVVNMAVSHDAKYIFSAGGKDATVQMWLVNLNALEAQERLGGKDLIPFYGLLDGGREGAFFHELENLFYYAQIRSQGIYTTDTRKVSVTIPISEIPFVMRALGFYPTEQEIEEMMNEIKFGNYVETGEYTTEIDLGNFIKLYVNHRPAFGLHADKLLWAFKVLGIQDSDGIYAIDRGELFHMLQNTGEPMTETELAEDLSTLLGFTPEAGSCEREDHDVDSAEMIEKTLPQKVTAEMFIQDLLGFQLCKQPEGVNAKSPQPNATWG